MRRLRVLTWHVHGNYLWYMTQAQHEFYLPVGMNREGYGGRGDVFPLGENVHDIHYEDVPNQNFDCVLFQSRQNFEVDRNELLSASQQQLPSIYLEHNPPWNDVVEERHPATESSNTLLVHCTHYNRLMWDSQGTPTKVIEHGVMIPDHVRYGGEVERGIVVVNHLQQRGRMLGADIFVDARDKVPLDLVGMKSEDLNGLGEISPPKLAEFVAQYRLFFNPIRYTSLGLAILEAMTIGLPIVGVATCELVSVIRNGENGFIDTNVANLVQHMQRLLQDPAEAQKLGSEARRYALERFNIDRFARDWEQTIWEVAGDNIPRAETSRAAKEHQRA